MQRFGRLILTAAAAVLTFLVLPATAAAQGATTGAIGGQVTDSMGAPIEGATVRVASAGTGLARSAVTGANGRYVIGGLEVDVYRVSAVAIGYRPEAIAGVRVSLSNTSRADFKMGKQVVQLQEIVATAAHDRRSRSRRRAPAPRPSFPIR